MLTDFLQPGKWVNILKFRKVHLISFSFKIASIRVSKRQIEKRKEMGNHFFKDTYQASLNMARCLVCLSIRPSSTTISVWVFYIVSSGKRLFHEFHLILNSSKFDYEAHETLGQEPTTTKNQ